jgi:hypothetical protein
LLYTVVEKWRGEGEGGEREGGGEGDKLYKTMLE